MALKKVCGGRDVAQLCQRTLTDNPHTAATPLLFVPQQVRMEAWEDGVPATALREISVLKEVCDHPI